MKIIYLVIIIFIFGSNAFAKQKYFRAPNNISDCTFSCSPDKGSIIDNYPSYVFKTSKNNKNVCKGGIYNQRAEITMEKALSLSTNGRYNFQTIFKIKDNSGSFYPEKFDIFQIHDSRDGCAPPLKVNVQSGGQLRLYADYKTDPGEQCVKDVIKSTGTGSNEQVKQASEIVTKNTTIQAKLIGYKQTKTDAISMDGKYQFYVLIEYPIGKANQALLNTIKQDEVLSTQKDSDKAMAELEAEIDKRRKK